MQRYVIFAGETYYPGGGWHDMRGACDSLHDACIVAETLVKFGKYDWSHVVDLETMNNIKSY